MHNQYTAQASKNCSFFFKIEVDNTPNHDIERNDVDVRLIHDRIARDSSATANMVAFSYSVSRPENHAKFPRD